MADLRAKFMKILRAELEDLIEDVSVAERIFAQRFAHDEVTDYVFRQNDALFQGECEAFRLLLGRLKSFDHERFADLDGLVRSLDALVMDIIRDHERPEAVHEFVSRKIGKVRRYVESGCEP